MCFIYLNKLVWIIISFIDRFDDVSIYLLLKKKKVSIYLYASGRWGNLGLVSSFIRPVEMVIRVYFLTRVII